MVLLSALPTVMHIRRWAVNTVPTVGQTMQFGDNYLNDGHLPPEIPQIDGRDSFNSVSQLSLSVSFEVPNWSSRRLAVAKAWIGSVLCGHWLLVLRVCGGKCGGGIKWPPCRRATRRGRCTDGHGGLRQRCADGGCVRLRTPIRKNSWDPRTDADGSHPKIRERGMTRIINLSSVLGKLTRWAQWADAIV